MPTPEGGKSLQYQEILALMSALLSPLCAVVGGAVQAVFAQGYPPDDASNDAL